LVEKDKAGRSRDAQADVHSGHNCCADIYVLSRNNQGPNPTFLTVGSVISLMAGGVEGGDGVLLGLTKVMGINPAWRGILGLWLAPARVLHVL